MTTDANPYRTPQAAESLAHEPSRALAVGRAQKMIIYAILLNLAGAFIMIAVGTAAVVMLINLVALVLSIVGIVSLAIGLGNGIALRILYVVLMFIPLVNLITLLILNSKATRMLRAAGYEVGLLGANLSAAPRPNP